MSEKKTSKTDWNASDLVPVESVNIDVTPFVGKMAKIESVEVMKGQNGLFLKATTEIIEIVEGIELRASRLFGLRFDKDGNLGWPEQGNLAVYLSAMKLKNPSELVGKKVQIVLTKENAQGRRFLTF